MRGNADRRALLTLSGGHAATDFANGSLPALLPFFVERFSLSYTLAAALMLASTFSSSIIQPLFGAFSDRFGAIWLLPAGIAVAGTGIAASAVMPSYGLVVVCVVVSGIGVASYHPEAAKYAAFASGPRRASGMSIFSVGGNAGYALGPIIATPLVLWLGLDGGVLLVVPPLCVAVFLALALAYLRGFEPRPGAHSAFTGATRRRPLYLLLGIISLRSVVWFGLVTFIPLWEVSENGHSTGYGNALLTVMLVCGAAGTLILGPLADRFGRRTVMAATLAPLPLLVMVPVLVDGAAAFVALAVCGMLIQGTFGVSAVMAQEYMPSRVGLASGLSIGLSIGVGGIAAVLLGAVADSIDLRAALIVVALAPIPALVLTSLLPASRARRLAPEPAAS